MSEAKFNKAVTIVQSLPKTPARPVEDQLFFYKYFKQATIGDNETAKPGIFDFTGKAKWEAWTSVKGTTKEEAWSQYVGKLLEILKAATDDQSKKHIEEIEAA
ncbi:acyl-CoA-binding protein [Phlegmacium glaucopus]|nr:acyl-CoA-binding protein [Phlegmacium glaucopus]